MILWINGAFGSGKTQTAFEINRRLENSCVYDPENIGYFLRRNMPKEIIKGNFQDQALWRTFNYEIIKNIYAKYHGHIIIPMTIYDKNYFEEIIGKLLRENIRIDHYILGASRATILKRLAKRYEGKNSWAAQQIDICLRGFNELPGESIRIDTNELSIGEIAEIIAKRSNIELKEDRNIEIIKKIKRTITQIRHIRFLLPW
jgi:RNase adaptor protein for sRNA GlmZ degradation